MRNPYGFHPWSKEYRAEMLREARKRDLLARPYRQSGRLRRLTLSWWTVSALLLGIKVAGRPSECKS